MKQKSTANVVSGIASFFIPGLGQLVNGRVGVFPVRRLSTEATAQEGRYVGGKSHRSPTVGDCLPAF